MNSKNIRFLLFIGIVSGLLLHGGYRVYQVDDWYQEADDESGAN